jgi:hypothetical protein
MWDNILQEGNDTGRVYFPYGQPLQGGDKVYILKNVLAKTSQAVNSETLISRFHLKFNTTPF